ncbi:DUF4190 domain-containing protein [Aeromicrobium sp. P5_D10]
MILHPPPRPHAPGATVSLVLGLFSVIGIFAVLPVVLGPLAWYHGVNAQREIEREPARWSGAGEARAGVILGVIGTCLLALVLLVMTVLVAGAIFAHHYDAGYGT